jgi:protein-ribulosamine 3-kinase
MDSQILSLLKSPGFKSSPISGSSDFPIHENILSKSPPGTNILSVQRVGISLWTITGKLSIQSPDIPPNHYFLKLAASSTGKLMLEGEFASMTALHTSLPTFIPKPHSSGSFTIDKTPIYFMLSEYIEFSEILPGPEQFCEKLARLHKDSVSPTGKFGFEVTTCNGMTPQATQGWDGSWGVVFTRLLVGMLGRDREFNGVWEALDGLEKRFVEGVVTRLVGALEEEGRKIKPCVIHGRLLLFKQKCLS